MFRLNSLTVFLHSSPSPVFLPSSMSLKASRDMKQVFHKAVKKISHVRVVTQLYMPEDDDNVMMAHH